MHIPFLSPLLFTLPHSHRFPSPTSRLHILCLLVVTFLSFAHFISIIIITSSIFEVVIPIKVRLLIILSVAHILFLILPFLLCCHLYKYKSSQQTLLVHATTISNVCANPNIISYSGKCSYFCCSYCTSCSGICLS